MWFRRRHPFTVGFGLAVLVGLALSAIGSDGFHVGSKLAPRACQDTISRLEGSGVCPHGMHLELAGNKDDGFFTVCHCSPPIIFQIPLDPEPSDLVPQPEPFLHKRSEPIEL